MNQPNKQCKIVGPHSHLVQGQSFECEKEGQPAPNGLYHKPKDLPKACGTGYSPEIHKENLCDCPPPSETREEQDEIQEDTTSMEEKLEALNDLPSDNPGDWEKECLDGAPWTQEGRALRDKIRSLLDRTWQEGYQEGKAEMAVGHLEAVSSQRTKAREALVREIEASFGKEGTKTETVGVRDGVQNFPVIHGYSPYDYARDKILELVKSKL